MFYPGFAVNGTSMSPKHGLEILLIVLPQPVVSFSSTFTLAFIWLWVSLPSVPAVLLYSDLDYHHYFQ